MEDSQDTTEPSSSPSGISTGQWVLLGTLAALTAVAVVLAYAARKAGQPSSMVDIPEGNEPWMVSLRHFVSASEYRFLGVEAKLAEHDALLGIKPPPPPAAVDRTFHPTPVPPAPEPVSMSGVPVGAEEPAPPGPAATSLPPNADH